jgi:hypothetical protein
MMEDVLPSSIVRQGFTITVESGDAICLKLSGNADMEMVPVLEPYLRQLHQYLCGVRARSVTVDLCELYFMNSACFKAIITWIASVSSPGQIKRYSVKFVTNPRLNWQRRNLRSILDFAPGVVTVSES